MKKGHKVGERTGQACLLNAPFPSTMLLPANVSAAQLAVHTHDSSHV